MPATLVLTSYEETTAQIVHDVFETMLGSDVHESDDVYQPTRNQVTATIFFAGAWKGAVVLECSEAQGRLFASRLMQVPELSEMSDDVRDAMGELVNIVAGNLKSVLPHGVSLSIPSVLEGPEYAFKVCGRNQTVRFAFRGQYAPFWVTLVYAGLDGSNGDY